MYRPIEDYALIGNLISSALVSKDASIDWAPMPYIHSPSVFASILDDEIGGYWKLSSIDEGTEIRQLYLDRTAIVVTRFSSHKGVFEVSDFMPIINFGEIPLSEEGGSVSICRRISCISGNCNVRVECTPRFDYSRGETSCELHKEGVEFMSGDSKGFLRSTFKGLICHGGIAEGLLTMKEGQVEYMEFFFGKINDLRPISVDSLESEFESCKTFWKNWSSESNVDAVFSHKDVAKAVQRSELTLKLLTFKPTGALVAAPTTSLACDIGGVRNWDYRFNWVRDSCFILKALSKTGHFEEVIDYTKGIVDICFNPKESRWKELEVLFDMNGKEGPEEEILNHFKGYRCSKPVRIGNAAGQQCQKDIYGSFLDMAWEVEALWLNDDMFKDRLWSMVAQFADSVASVWREPDHGIWEFRMKPEHHLYSKVMSWVALDRALRIAKRYGFEGDFELWQKERRLIKEEVFEKGWNEKKRSFVQYYGSKEVDASLLIMSSVGFIRGDDPRMVSTIRAIERDLGFGDGLLLRYRNSDGLPGKDGAFLVTSFWLVDALVLAGELERAEVMYRNIIKRSNHVGLLSEQIDTETGAFLGNFPQGYSHMGLINSAFLLEGRVKGEFPCS